MRILHLLYDDVDNPWLGGGGAYRTWEIYKRFPAQYRITVATGSYPGSKVARYRGLLYVRAGSPAGYLASRLTYAIKSHLLVAKGDFDLAVEDFSPYSPVFLPVVTRKPSLAIIQNIYGKRSLEKGLFLGPLGVVAEQVGLRAHRHFIAVSNSIAETIRKTSTRILTLAVIYNGVSEELFAIVPRDEKHILFIGRLDIRQKGLDLLVQAYSMAYRPGFPPLLIAGSGRDEDEVKQLVRTHRMEDRIRLVGKIGRDEKVKLLSESIFLCMPSRFESWGMTAIEAGAAGKAVLGYDVPGLNEAVVNGKTGILVPAEATQELAEVMISLARDGHLRRSLGEAGRIRARNFRWDEISQQTERTYQRAIDGY